MEPFDVAPTPQKKSSTMFPSFVPMTKTSPAGCARTQPYLCPLLGPNADLAVVPLL